MNATSSPGANGVYNPDGTYSGITKYNNGAYTLFKTVDQFMRWAIVPNGTNLASNDVANSLYSYSTKIDGSVPPFRGWHQGGNTTGLPGEYIIVTPLNSIGYNVHNFTESITDDGTIMDTALVYLYAEGITLTGINEDDFIVEGKAIITGLPSGLTGKLIRKSDTTLLAVLDGISTNHTMNDNTLIHLDFDNSAVSNGDISILTNAAFDFGIIYQSPYFIEGTNTYPTAIGVFPLMGIFNEYPYFVNDIYYLATKSCNPKWIIRSQSNVHPLYSTQIQTEYPENRQWHMGGFFYSMGDPIVVGMMNSILYETYSLIESNADDGTFSDSLKIRYYHPETGNSFSGNVGDDFVSEGKILVSNIPEGLAVEIIKFNDTTLYAHLTGQATHHEVTDNIENLKFEFTASAFNGPGIFATNNRAIDSVNVVHMQQYILADTTNFPWDVNGLYSPFEMINGVTAYKNQADYYIVYRNTPPNCVWGVLRQGNQGVVFSSGSDLDYPPSNNWVRGDYNGTDVAHIEVFPVQPWLSYYDLIIDESTEAPCNVDDSMKIYLNNPEGITFTGEVSEEYISANKAEVINLPEGLSASLVKDNDTEVTLYISGMTLNHQTSDNINNLTIRFRNEAFSINPETIKFTTIYSGKIKYNNITSLGRIGENVQSSLFFPNPSREFIHINAVGLDEGNVTYRLYDSLGKAVIEGQLKEEKINISSLSKGMYVVLVETKNRILTDKLVVN